jgi:hypothetical protein
MRSKKITKKSSEPTQLFLKYLNDINYVFITYFIRVINLHQAKRFCKHFQFKNNSLRFVARHGHFYETGGEKKFHHETFFAFHQDPCSSTCDGSYCRLGDSTPVSFII